MIRELNSKYREVSLTRICRLFGLTRQAYYQYFWRDEGLSTKHSILLKEVLRIRELHKSMGVRKLYEKLSGFLHDHKIKLGRDGLFDLLSRHNLLVRRRKKRITTTMSYHRFHKWPNLIKEHVLTSPNQLYVSDITYWKISTGHLYISLITDAFSHKIVGYNVAETLEAIESVRALRMALSALSAESHPSLTHHSDRGIQYCSKEYIELLQSHDIKISMTENGDPRENAVAERINGILKNEYLEHYEINNIKEARELLKASIELYNTDRPHMSIEYKTPIEIHQSHKQTKQKWKNYYQKKEPVNQI